MEKNNTSKLSEVMTKDSNSKNQNLKWETPSISVMRISKLTAGIIPVFKDLPLPGLGAGS